MKPPSTKQRVRDFFLKNIGRVVSSKQIRDAAGDNVVEVMRRLRELRNEEGWKILTQRDDPNLKPRQYLLKEKPPENYDYKFSRKISGKTRAYVLDRNGFTCRCCGIGAGEIHPHNGKKAVLQVSHIIDKSLGGTDDPDNLRAMCSVCNEGAKNITQEKPTFIHMMAQIRRAPVGEQQKVFLKLKERFEPTQTS